MKASTTYSVILHVRVPRILEGCDQQRYLERKLDVFGLRLRPPMYLPNGDPVGYPLASPLRIGRQGSVLEVRGEVAPGVTLLALLQHPLVENALDAVVEDERRAKRAAECAKLPNIEDTYPEGGVTAGPNSRPGVEAVLTVLAWILSPLDWAHRRLRRIRAWYVREHG